LGVYVKDGNNNWQMFSTGLPNVMVTELDIYYDETTPSQSKIIAASYGRGLWESDLLDFNVAPIQLNSIEGPFYVSDVTTASIDIPFEINETFSSNTFTAYLSDNTGDFTSEINIGELVSDVAGTIQATIPAGTVSGTGYKVKVKSSNPVNESPESSSFEIILDNDSPTVNTSSVDGNVSSSNPVPVEITFNEEVSGFAQGDIVIGNGTLASLSTEDSTLFELEIDPTTEGNITVDIPADIATDIVGNGNTAATQFSILYDGTAPEGNITTTATDTINTKNFTIKIQFSEKVENFTIDDINVYNGSGSNLVEVDVDSVWNADISALGSGVVTVRINTGSLTDIAGNENAVIEWSIVYTNSDLLLLQELGIKIYPNPSNGKFRIDMTERNVEQITILDISGRLIHKENLKQQSSKEIDLSEFAKGIYILKLNVNNKELTSKIIIE